MIQSKNVFPEIGMQEAAKLGVAGLIKKSEYFGALNMTKNNRIIGVMLPMFPNDDAFDLVIQNLKRLHETKKLSKDHPVLNTDDLNYEYLRNFILLIFSAQIKKLGTKQKVSLI